MTNTNTRTGIITSVVWPLEGWEVAATCIHCGQPMVGIIGQESFCSTVCEQKAYAEAYAEVEYIPTSQEIYELSSYDAEDWQRHFMYAE